MAKKAKKVVKKAKKSLTHGIHGSFPKSHK